MTIHIKTQNSMIFGVNLIDCRLIGLVGEPDLQLQPAGISQRKDVLNVGNVESKLYVDFDGLKINPIPFEDFKINIWMYSKFEVLQLWT